MTEGSWRIAGVAYAEVRRLADELGVSDTLAQVLVRRGFRDAASSRAFLYPDCRVHNPYLLAGMAEARHRIDRALQRGELIAVYGDYDADGVTATFVMARMLSELGARVQRRLPNRFTEGYGVSESAVRELAEEGVTLIITVDCGINARHEVAVARELGVDVIVTDHHELEGELPACIAISPKLGGYPCPDLAGVGVAFKLAHALLERPEEDLVQIPLALRPLTDVVAVGTIADVVPLVGENRVLASVGLARLRSAPRPGFSALLQLAGAKPGAVDAGTVGFKIAPRINASGRLDDALKALELLDCETLEAALPIARRLDELNYERRALEAAMLAEAVALVPEPLPPALVLSSQGWHEGVIGIVASRIAERFCRPTILLSEGEEEAKGSGRSVPGFDLLAAVEGGAEHLLAFGGHRAACGLRLRRTSINAFRERFIAHARGPFEAGEFVRTLEADAVVGCGDLTLELADELELLAPHGFGNSRVTLLLHGAEIVTPQLTRDRKHLRYRLRGDGSSCQAIHFNNDRIEELLDEGRYDLPVALSKNEYNGSVSAQVSVKGLYRLAPADLGLCPAASCSRSCADCLRGSSLWEELLREEDPFSWVGGREELSRARREGRLRDLRGRSAVSASASLLAGGERTLFLVADVASRRSLLGEVLSPQLGRNALRLQSACAGRCALAVAESDVVMTGYDLALARPELTAGFAHVLLFDPPPSRIALAAVAEAAPEAWLHAVWGPDQKAFAAGVMARQHELDGVLRHVWRALAAGSGELDDDLEERLLADGEALHSVSAVHAAFRALREVGLLVLPGANRYHLVRPESKVVITATETYNAWHRLLQKNDLS